jgi:hypothetical protein
MPSVADECWKLSGNCGRWAAETSDDATRSAFRQMAKVWAQLAFSLNFTPPPRDEPDDEEVIEGPETLKKMASEKPPILTEPEHPPENAADHHRSAQQQRLSLPSKTPFPKR